MAKKIAVLRVLELTGLQLQMLLYPSRVTALYSEEVPGGPYMVCVVDPHFRHGLPVVSDPEVYARLFDGLIAPDMMLTDGQTTKLIDGLMAAQKLHCVKHLLKRVVTTH